MLWPLILNIFVKCNKYFRYYCVAVTGSMIANIEVYRVVFVISCEYYKLSFTWGEEEARLLRPICQFINSEL